MLMRPHLSRSKLPCIKPNLEAKGRTEARDKKVTTF